MKMIAIFILLWGSLAMARAEEPTLPVAPDTAVSATAPDTAETYTLAGRLRAGYDAQGNLTSLELIDADESEFRLVLTPETRPLADWNGRQVSVVGTIELEADVQWLQVQSCQLMESP